MKVCERTCGCACDEEDCSCVRTGRPVRDEINAESRDTPLTHACRGSAPEHVAELLRKGEDANKPNRAGDTPLVVASSYGRTDLVKALLEGGADPNGRDMQGYTVLMRAVESGSVDVTYELLKAGADATAKVADGATSLYIAARAGQYRVVEELLKHLVEQKQFGFIDAVLRSTVKKARRMGLEELALRLVRAGSHLNGQDRYGYTPLMLAAREGLANLVDEMISHGASVAMQSRFDGDTALTLACSHSYHYYHHYRRTAQILLDAGANVNHTTTDFGMTPLAFAVNAGNAELVNLLLSSGADANHIDREGLTPLLRAIWKRDESQSVAVRARLATALLRGGARINGTDRQGRTPLHAAVERAEALPQSELLIMLLIQAGANRAQRNKVGLSPSSLDRHDSTHHHVLCSHVPSLKLLAAARVREALRCPVEAWINELSLDKQLQQVVLEGFLDGLEPALQAAEIAAQQATGTLVSALQDQIDAAAAV